MDFTALFGNQTPRSESEESLPTSSTAPRSTPAYSTSAPPSSIESAASSGSSAMTRQGSFYDDRGETPRPGYVPLTRKKGGKGRRRARRGGYDLRSSTLKKRADLEARIKAKEEEALKRRQAEIQKKTEQSAKSPVELAMEAAHHAAEANRLEAEAARMREFAQRVRDTPKELDELSAMMASMGMGGRRTKKTRRMKSRRRRV
jgi:hypothetical protein